MPARLIQLGPLLALLGAQAAQAQVTVDVAKISCQQYLTDQVAPTRNITNWLHGYYNAKRSNTIIDVGAMQKAVDQLQGVCRMNPDMPVMDAANKLFGTEK
jgi:acid stress chaperone HdeB